MKNAQVIPAKIFSRNEVVRKVAQWRNIGKSVAFTNGCFDILHQGHIFSLSQAAEQADFLIVGLNSDASTRRLKGPARPVNKEQSRALILASLVMVDAVVIFEEDTPLDLIMSLQPDVLVKGGDYTIDQVVGAKEVIASGGKVVINPIMEGFSTTNTISKINTLGETPRKI
jgi:D-beta-D-heptose 7-phosphate kinase/D-beta-D-heptose 1-phosphate adenosyltransferase